MTVGPDLPGRLAALRGEFEKGRHAMADLHREQQELHERMLRIAGAIEVLEELTTDGQDPDPAVG